MNIRGLDLSLVDGPTLRDADIEEMWGLRARFMTPRPEIAVADHRESFASWMRAAGSTVALARDRAGAIQVYIDMNSRRWEHKGESYLVCHGNYIYAATEYRNHPAYTLGNFRNLFAQLLRRRTWPTKRVLWVGPAFPSSFVVGARTFREFWAAGEPDVPHDIAEVIDGVAPHLLGEWWVPDTRLVRVLSLPPEYVPHSREGGAILARYEARNPRWREGYCTLIVAPLTLGNILGPLRLAAGRTLRVPYVAQTDRPSMRATTFERPPAPCQPREPPVPATVAVRRES